ncbi:hypothetical protein [Oceanobacillus sp. CAU 1775]
MKVSYIKVFTLILSILILTGCMYPNSERVENQVPNDTQLANVQAAVDQYREESGGLVPIRTKPDDTPIFEKYLIDFSMLKNENAIHEIPGNAFESGGYYQYILITPEDNPLVKVIDLRITEALRSVNIRMDTFKRQNTYPPYGNQVEGELYTLDYERLNYDEHPTVISPYSQEKLPIIMDVFGNLYIDYRIDLKLALDTFDHDYVDGDDIRYLLTDHYPFAPAYSLPYTVKDGEPVFLVE